LKLKRMISILMVSLMVAMSASPAMAQSSTNDQRGGHLLGLLERLGIYIGLGPHNGLLDNTEDSDDEASDDEDSDVEAGDVETSDVED